MTTPTPARIRELIQLKAATTEGKWHTEKRDDWEDAFLYCGNDSIACFGLETQDESNVRFIAETHNEFDGLAALALEAAELRQENERLRKRMSDLELAKGALP